MANNINSNPVLDHESTPTGTFRSGSSTNSAPARDYPGTHSEDATVKNPKTPETSGQSGAERVANNAAHKAAKKEQDFDKENGRIFTK